MLEVTFDIPTIKKLEPKLYEHFGFTFDDILYELTQVYIRKSTNLTPEEKEIAKQCKTENGATDAIKFALAIKENIHIRVTETFPDSLKLLLDLFNEYNITELKDGETLSCILLFMAAIFNRDFNHLLDDTDYDYISEEYYEYIDKIRPDMLKLYLSLHQRKRAVSDKLKISIQGNPPTELNNHGRWFENMLLTYLDTYLGVASKEEALTELSTLYSEPQGRKTKDNYYRNYTLTSMFLFVRQYIIHSGTDKVTVEQCSFLHKYLTALNLITKEDKNNDLNNLQSTIRSLISSKFSPLDKYKKGKEYKASPNNKGDKLY